MEQTDSYLCISAECANILSTCQRPALKHSMQFYGKHGKILLLLADCPCILLELVVDVGMLD